MPQEKKKKNKIFRVIIGEVIFEFDNASTAMSFAELAFTYITTDENITIDMK